MILGYSRAVLLPDLLRAGGGVLLAVALPLVGGASVVSLVLGGLLFVLFAVLGLQALGRRRLRLALGADGVGIAPAGRTLAWQRLSRLRLAYYSTRRDGRRGWMELTLADEGGVRLRVDSRLEGFDQLARDAARAAQERRLELDRATRSNLEALASPEGWAQRARAAAVAESLGGR